ncbi:NADPH-dependent F420 reductase [Streptomyces zingiberis]|uniref:NAD(P)-binding domain-containing protein n=1 Tax=Streptomyces zingiberis TaxID=2053010 RepID=A0ABX1BVW0_9ACTN|nr:NAD(P)-binding domain-containing protein [Streptomyces zingiberis]NJQ01847.1 NAD(P)-binding domain-containing protein [Streptomyces zingiberis]
MHHALGIIGSGSVGGAVARLAVDAGIPVVLSNSYGPETPRDLTDRLGPRARAASPPEAAAAGDWTVVAVPFSAVPHLPADALAGKIVIDANNYCSLRDGVIAELETGSLTAGELFQRHLAGARTVKTFNTISFEHLLSLARPAGSPDRSALPIAGDDDAAKESVTALLDRLGYDTVDAGAMTESRRIQEGSPAYVLPYLSDPRLPWSRDPGKPAGAGEIRTALEQARSGHEKKHGPDRTRRNRPLTRRKQRCAASRPW